MKKRIVRQFGIFLALLGLFASVPILSASNDCLTAGDGNAVPAIPLQIRDEYGRYVPVHESMLPPIENYLNTGGSPDQLQAALDAAAEQSDDLWLNRVHMQDVTGDEMPDLIVQVAWLAGERSDSALDGGIFVYRCDDERYTGYLVTPLLGFRGGNYEFNLGAENGLRFIEDMNANGLPELIVSYIYNVGMTVSYDRLFSIHEWNGDGFSSLIPAGEYGSLAAAYNGDGELRDVNGDGLAELVMTNSVFFHHDFTRWSRLDRSDEMIWSWNGEMYELTCTRAAAAPQYRIQAVQDGGDAMLCGDYKAALAFYQQVIEDDALLPWSEADNLCSGCVEAYGGPDLAAREAEVRALGIPVPDPDERDRLSAYARYRLVLVYTALGQDEEAEAVLSELRDSTPDDGVGSEYVVLGETFWETYRETGDPVVACQAVEQYAEASQIATPLTRYNFHGLSSSDPYGSEDICPL